MKGNYYQAYYLLLQRISFFSCLNKFFLNLIFFFFIRAGAKAPASFHFWGKYPVYKVNGESQIRENEIKYIYRDKVIVLHMK